MVDTTNTGLVALACSKAAYVGFGAMTACGGGAGASWLGRLRQHPVSTMSAVCAIDPIPTATGTRLSAPPERSP